MGRRSRAHCRKPAQVIKITASKFRFTPDHIALVKGQPVTLQITSADATHGFMVRALKHRHRRQTGQDDRGNGHARKAGTFTAICDHYCGLGHGAMKMTIVVEAAVAKSSAAP